MKPNAKKLLANLFVVGLVGLLMFLAVMFGGCAARVKNVTDLPAGVQLTEAQQWDAEVANLHKIADVTSTLRKTVITLRGSGEFSDDKSYATTLASIAHVDQLQIQAVQFLKAEPTVFGTAKKTAIKIYIQQIAQELLTLTSIGATGIKNPDNQRIVGTLLTELSSAANLVLQLTQ